MSVPPDVSLSQSVGRTAFGSDAAGYHAGRIGYPDALFAALFHRTVPHPDIAEIGAGTGLATQGLWACAPRHLTAIEPDPELVAFLRARFPDQPLTTITSGFMESSLAGDFDLITCAAAFHWMDAAPALGKVIAHLRPGGVWAMWWNSYLNPDAGDPLADAIMPLLDGIALPPSVRRHGHYSLDVAHHHALLDAAGFVGIEHEIHRRERLLSTAEVRALYASYSFVRSLAPPQQADLLDRISALVDARFGGMAPNLVLTACYSACRPAFD